MVHRCKAELRTDNFSAEERMTIACMHRDGSSVRTMARTLDRSAGTVSRELARNTSARCGYVSASA